MLGLIVAGTLCFSDNVIVRDQVYLPSGRVKTETTLNPVTGKKEVKQVTIDRKSTETTMPFYQRSPI